MVVTLKDGTVVTLFDVKEVRELIGDELFEFIEHEYTKKDERDERVSELVSENNDLSHDICVMEDLMSSSKGHIDDALFELDQLNKKNVDEKIKIIKEHLEDAMEMLND